MGKIFIITSVIVILFCTESKCQTYAPKFGIKAGANSSKYLGGFNDLKNGWTLGYYGGAFANIWITDRLELQPELLLEQNKFYRSNTVSYMVSYHNFATVFLKEKTSELTISTPITIRYYLSNRFFVEGGGYFGYILSQKINHQYKYYTDYVDNDYKYSKKFVDYGVLYGTGFHLSNKLALGLRCFTGLAKREFNGSQFFNLNLGIEYTIF